MGDPSSPTGADRAAEVTVVVSDEQAEVEIDASRWGRLASAVLEAEGVAGELTLTFVDRDEIASLNAEHMGHEEPTDVLSFPLDADETDPVVAGPVLLGDVVICPAVAAANAPDHAGTVDDELALLTVHGLLHVLGHDHGELDEARVMRAKEIDLLERHFWNGPAPAGFAQDHRS